ncbi:hypothetical protein ACP70R_007216 [Stipagrostis hirtigluma subsp. patula]
MAHPGDNRRNLAHPNNQSGRFVPSFPSPAINGAQASQFGPYASAPPTFQRNITLPSWAPPQDFGLNQSPLELSADFGLNNSPLQQFIGPTHGKGLAACVPDAVAALDAFASLPIQPHECALGWPLQQQQQPPPQPQPLLQAAGPGGHAVWGLPMPPQYPDARIILPQPTAAAAPPANLYGAAAGWAAAASNNGYVYGGAAAPAPHVGGPAASLPGGSSSVQTAQSRVAAPPVPEPEQEQEQEKSFEEFLLELGILEGLPEDDAFVGEYVDYLLGDVPAEAAGGVELDGMLTGAGEGGVAAGAPTVIPSGPSREQLGLVTVLAPEPFGASTSGSRGHGHGHGYGRSAAAEAREQRSRRMAEKKAAARARAEKLAAARGNSQDN